MMNKQLHKSLFLGMGALMLTVPPLVFAIDGTPSLTATLTSTIEAGTCNAQIKDKNGAAASIIGFGDVFKSDLERKTRKENFQLSFSGCSGVHGALVNTQIAASCSGTSGNGNSYPNAGGTSAATAVEIWNGQPDSGTEFNCNTRSTAQDIAISGGTKDVAMSARMVIASGKTINDVSAGTFQAPITFVITYR
ncbi:fimbrial protein [Pseudescherichia vulneris]